MTEKKWTVYVPGKNLQHQNEGTYFKTYAGKLAIITSQQYIMGTFGIDNSQYEFTKEELKKFGLTNCPKHLVDEEKAWEKYMKEHGEA